MKKVKSFVFVLCFLSITVCAQIPVQPGIQQDALETNFRNPPREARPGSWYFWMGGNISEYGIRTDLEAMARTGLSSVVMMQVSTFGRTPDGEVNILSDEWYNLLDYYLTKSAWNNMDVVLFTTPTGWSMLGDTSVKPSESTKRLTYSEIIVNGGEDQPVKLPEPYSVLDVYEDLSVIAFPDPADGEPPVPEVSSHVAGVNWGLLFDKDWQTGIQLPEYNTSIQLIYPQPVRVNALRFSMRTWRTRPASVRIEAMNEQDHWEHIGTMDTYWPHGPRDVPLVIRLKAIESQRFRLTFEGGNNPEIDEIELCGFPLVDLFSPKAGYSMRREHGQGADLFRLSTEQWGLQSNMEGLDPGNILDLTGQLKPDGTLEWDPPDGHWRIVRIGWTTCGHVASPSPPGVRLYIVDPTEKGAVEQYWQGFPNQIISEHGRQVNGAITAVETESWEAGNLNWAPGFEEEFMTRRGYDLSRFWPVLAGGYIVGDVLESDRFLRDFRLTLAELISENYYAEVARMADLSGVKYLGESTGRQQFLYHPTEFIRHSNVPVGEFWVNDGLPRPDCRAGASMAHFYGHKMVASESYTALAESYGFDLLPFDYKKLGDEAFIEGINHFKLLLNSQTPYEGPEPGIVAANWGSQMVTGNTWWGRPARGWTDYLARCQYMLQQGRNVADILYFAGEDFPAELPGRGTWDPAKNHILMGSRPVEGSPPPPVMNPEIPRSIEFDVCGPAELLNHLEVDTDGTLISLGGARYRILMLRDWTTMSPEIARRIEELVESGATVIGPPPLHVPGLTGLEASELALRSVREKLWGTSDRNAVIDRQVGEGRVIWNKTLPEIFSSINLPMDFEPPSGHDVRFRHRRGDSFDLYFISNQLEEPFTGELGFRVSGRQPELWDPNSGRRQILQNWTESGGVTSGQVELGPYGSAFIVFQESGQQTEEPPVDQWVLVDDISFTGPWEVGFQKDRGAPDRIELDNLLPLNTHIDPGVKYFSGTATYSQAFNLDEGMPGSGSRVVLDLGVVHGIAEVSVNGSRVANLWYPPYKAVIEPELLTSGANTLEIAVTNSWRNRMIGDERYPRDFEFRTIGNSDYITEWPDWYINGEPRPVKERVSFCTSIFYKKDDPLHPSGLVGPVKMEISK